MSEDDHLIDDFTYFDSEIKEEKEKLGAYNKDYEKDVNHAIRFNRGIATIIGIWPSFSVKREGLSRITFRTIIKRIHNLILYCLLAYLIIPGVLHILLEERTFKRRMLKTGPMVVNSMALVKYSVLLFRQNKIRECLKLIESDWRDAGVDKFRHMMRRNAVVGRRLTRVCVFTWYIGGICYRLIKTLLTPNRYTPTGLMIKPLPSPLFAGIFRFNTSVTPIYESLFAGQMLASVVVHSTTVTTCSYAAVLVTHACGQFDIVTHLLQQLVADDGDNGRLTTDGKISLDRRLRIVVQLHLKVLRFVKSVEDLLCEVCLVEVVGGTLVLVLTGYYFLMDWGKNDALGIVTYFTMIASLVILLFTYCFIGELVAEKAQKVEANSYLINWYDLPPRKGLCIGLIISSSRYPPKLTAGKMLDLTMYNFGSILKSAVGYLNLMRTMID